jgi:uncharacterized protein (DUF1778 family)
MAARTTTAHYNVRVSPADDIRLREAAAVVGASVSEFLVSSGRERAGMVLADRAQFVLGQDAWDGFCATLDRDAKIQPAVPKLMHRPRPE